MTNSRSKGSKNERQVSKLFAQWTGYEFARTPQSGGLHWRKSNTIGDIVCIDEKHGHKFPFSIECKFHAEADFSYLIDDTTGKKSNKIFAFWDQAKGDAMRVHKIPLLFIRRNMMKSDTHFVGMPLEYFNLLMLRSEIPLAFSLGVLSFMKDTYNIAFVNSEDFFKLPYQEVYRIALRFNRLNKKLNDNQ